MINPQLLNYLQTQSTFREKWKTYLNGAPNFSLKNKLDALTPFHGTKEYKNLTDENKDDLFINNVRLMAEALIVFEQILLFGYFTNRSKPRYSQEEFSKPFAQFTYEELYHSIAFRHFLASHEVFKKFPKELITNCGWLKNSFAYIVRRFPGALYICSPRLEALSLAYHNEIQKAYGPSEENSWLKLHQLHFQDEVHHIPLNYHFHDSFVQEHGLLNTLAGSLLFFIMIQIMLFKVAYGAVSQSFPRKSKVANTLLTLRFIRWSLKVSESHRGARVIMKRHVNKLKPRYQFIFSFLIK